VQALAPRICLPRGFNRQYRCVVTHIKGYTMEELANLIWIGDIIAHNGPDGFRNLWRMLQPAVKHYIFGFDATEPDFRAAHAQLRSYAEEVESRVVATAVRSLSCVHMRSAQVHKHRGRLRHVSLSMRI